MARISKVSSFAGTMVLAGLMITVRGEETVANVGPEWKYPLVYSTSLMAAYCPLLLAADTFDSGPSVNNFTRAYTTAPEWDNDSATFNFLLHPLWGSETYLRARESHFGVLGSIGFSFGMSVTWEYLIEAWVSQPSTQDLIFTTGIGWTIGELRYQLKQRANERTEWIVDPIQKTLEHFHIVVGRDREGDLSAGVGFAFRF